MSKPDLEKTKTLIPVEGYRTPNNDVGTDSGKFTRLVRAGRSWINGTYDKRFTNTETSKYNHAFLEQIADIETALYTTGRFVVTSNLLANLAYRSCVAGTPDDVPYTALGIIDRNLPFIDRQSTHTDTRIARSAYKPINALVQYGSNDQRQKALTTLGDRIAEYETALRKCKAYQAFDLISFPLPYLLSLLHYGNPGQRYRTGHKIDFMLLCGHGNSDSISLGVNPGVSPLRYNERLFGNEISKLSISHVQSFTDLRRYFVDHPNFILDSCSTGANEYSSIARFLSLAMLSRVIAPVSDKGHGRLTISVDTGHVTFGIANSNEQLSAIFNKGQKNFFLIGTRA